MIVQVLATGVTLEDVDTLTAFKVTAPETLRSCLSEALGAAGRFDGEAAWISEGWLRDQTTDKAAGWQPGFEKMLAFAKTKGWYDEIGKAVRGHIEWVA